MRMQGPELESPKCASTEGHASTYVSTLQDRMMQDSTACHHTAGRHSMPLHCRTARQYTACQHTAGQHTAGQGSTPATSAHNSMWTKVPFEPLITALLRYIPKDHEPQPHLGHCDAAVGPHHARQTKICYLHMEARPVTVNGEIQQLQHNTAQHST